MVLLHEERFCDLCWLTTKKIEKCRFEGSETWPGRPKIEAGAAQSSKKTTNMSQKSTKNVQEPAKSEKKTPKSEKCANMAPTWGVSTSMLERFGPLSKEKQYVNASIKCSGF